MFERIIYSYGVTVFLYHENNGLFDTKKFKEACNTEKMTLRFFGIDSCHQNGKSEKIIKDVTTGASTALFHAYHLWSNAIRAYLWTTDILCQP